MTHHNESIYETAKLPLPYQKKSDRYKSKFRKIITTEKHYNQKSERKHESMGLPEQSPPNPSEYLKKNSWRPPIKQNIETGKRSPITLPEVPLRNQVLKEQDEKLKHKEKDFVSINVKNAITMPPKIPKRRTVIERFGEAKLLEQGLEPKYISSKLFGRTPNYLKKEIKIREKLLQTQKDIIGVNQPKCRYITRDEREKLLEVNTILLFTCDFFCYITFNLKLHTRHVVSKANMPNF